MAYLDYDKFDAFIRRYLWRQEDRQARLVGRESDYDSGYYDIVRFFGPDAADPREVSIAYEPRMFRVNDALVADFARDIERSLREEGRLYDGPPATAVIREQFSGGSPTISLQACEYGLFAGCCFALDHPDRRFDDAGGTLRDYYHKAGCVLPPCLGICGLLKTAEPDGTAKILLVHRAKHLASLTGSVGPSAAGSVDFREGFKTLGDLIGEAMTLEVFEELRLDPSEYEIRPLAWARELFRGEKPQLFCLLESPLSSESGAERLRSLLKRPEFDRFGFAPLAADGTLVEENRRILNHEAMMNYFLMEEYLAVRTD
jgi:hypothetical protein